MGVASLKIAVLLSGSGSTLENLFVRRDEGALKADITVVLSSRADAFGLERARKRGIPALCVERKKFKSCEEFSAAVYKALEPFAPDLIVLAGFMCMLAIPEKFQHKVINVHPALLPAFGGKGYYGHHVHEAVLKHGCTVTGCTVHFVDNEYDRGPIIKQKAVDVLPDDTPESLAARVQAAEREIYPEVIEALIEGRVRIEAGRVFWRGK
jgi:phosphoribosylglycinamide formyltransferase-1